MPTLAGFNASLGVLIATACVALLLAVALWLVDARGDRLLLSAPLERERRKKALDAANELETEEELLEHDEPSVNASGEADVRATSAADIDG